MSACRRDYPGRIDGTDSLITPPSTSAFPRLRLGRLLHYWVGSCIIGSAPALTVSRPAQRSLALQPTDSPSRLMRPSTPEAPAALAASTAAPIATGWSDPVPGRV